MPTAAREQRQPRDKWLVGAASGGLWYRDQKTNGHFLARENSTRCLILSAAGGEARHLILIYYLCYNM